MLFVARIKPPLLDMGGEGLDCGPEDEDSCSDARELADADNAKADSGNAAGVAEARGATISSGSSPPSMIASTASSKTGGIATSTASLLLRT